LKGLPDTAGIVVVRDKRKVPVVPAWKGNDPNVQDSRGRMHAVSEDEEDLDKFYTSILIRQLVTLQALRKCLPGFESVLIADDDSYVPEPLLKGSLQVKLDPSSPLLLGKTVHSQMFIRRPWQAAYAEAVHCGGGSGMLLTRGLIKKLEEVAGGLSACLAEPFPVAYYSDVNIGACFFHYLGIRCTLPPIPAEEWSCHSSGVPTADFAYPERFKRGLPAHGENAGFACIPRRGKDDL
jgi:hypothetical protein